MFCSNSCLSSDFIEKTIIMIMIVMMIDNMYFSVPCLEYTLVSSVCRGSMSQNNLCEQTRNT